jgi:hypothetical protein
MLGSRRASCGSAAKTAALSSARKSFTYSCVWSIEPAKARPDASTRPVEPARSGTIVNLTPEASGQRGAHSRRSSPASSCAFRIFGGKPKGSFAGPLCDGASRTRTGDLLGAIQIRAILGSPRRFVVAHGTQRFAGTLSWLGKRASRPFTLIRARTVSYLCHSSLPSLTTRDIRSDRRRNQAKVGARTSRKSPKMPRPSVIPERLSEFSTGPTRPKGPNL